MVGPEAEATATVRRMGRMFVTGANLTVPYFTVVLRKAYGIGGILMAGGWFKAPRFVEFREELARTATGKLQKFSLFIWTACDSSVSESMWSLVIASLPLPLPGFLIQQFCQTTAPLLQFFALSFSPWDVLGDRVTTV